METVDGEPLRGNATTNSHFYSYSYFIVFVTVIVINIIAINYVYI